MTNLRQTIIASTTAGPETGADGVVGMEFCFRADASVFAGHFPGHPLLPGIFQLEMARVVAEAALGHALSITDISKAKFLSPVIPDETVRVEVRCRTGADSTQVRAVVRVADRMAGEAILEMIPTP